VEEPPGSAGLRVAEARDESSVDDREDCALCFRRCVCCLIEESSHLTIAPWIGAITHRLCRLIWKILHQRVRYEERGPAVSTEAKKVRARKMFRELRSLGYRVELLPAASSNPA
jgi:hypothetical protein